VAPDQAGWHKQVLPLDASSTHLEAWEPQGEELQVGLSWKKIKIKRRKKKKRKKKVSHRRKKE
jgi:hypothetical protein